MTAQKNRRFAISSLLSPTSLERMAGKRSYERGERYFAEGRVRKIVIHRETLSAEVKGSEVYGVELRIEANRLYYECDCPVGIGGGFCKHCVAAALAWSDRLAGDEETAGSDLEEIELMLRRMPKEELVAIVMERAAADERFRGSLGVRALLERGGKPQLSDYRKAIEQATQTGSMIERRQVRAFAARVREVARSIVDIASGAIDGSELPELMEELILRTIRVLPGVYDTDKYLGGLVEELEGMHYKLCARFHPDPLELASRLLQVQMEGGPEIFYDAFRTYAALLGKKGQRRYRELAAEAWSRCDHPSPTSDRGGGTSRIFDPRYETLKGIMGAIAEYTRDVEDRVNILRADLTIPHQYLRIARLYSEATLRKEAIEWGEKGLAAFPSNVALMEFLIGEHAHRKDFTAALDLAWRLFSHTPSLTSYARLKTYAEKRRSWSSWRERAIALIEALPSDGEPEGGTGGSSLLVEIFLWEKDDDAAWEQAIAGGCSDGLWLILADRRGARHPEDAIAIYEAQIESLGQSTDHRSYATIVELLKKMKVPMESLGRHEEFREYLMELRTNWRRRSRFVSLLDEAAATGAL